MQRRPPLSLLPLAAAIALSVSAPLDAANIVVDDSSSDSVVGKCTLTDAAAAVNTAAAVNGCAAGDGIADTIDLRLFTSPTTIEYTLANSADGNSALAFTKPVTLLGGLDANKQPQVTLTRSAVSGNFRLIAASDSLFLTGIALSNGASSNGGGAIYTTGFGYLTLRNSSVTNCVSFASGGGIFASNSANIRLINSVLKGNVAHTSGGGLYTPSTGDSQVSVYSSNVSGNTAITGSGGGVDVFGGDLNVRYSTIDGNTASGGSGGGLYVYGRVQILSTTISNNSSSVAGGGFWTPGPYVFVSESTITGNHAVEDAGAFYGSDTTVVSSTVTGNTVDSTNHPVGGVRFNSYCRLADSIITGNTGNNISGPQALTFSAYNIIAPSPFGDPPTLPGDTLNCDPMLGALADNGGLTKTMALPAGSCAIDAGPKPAALLHDASDQRGPMFERVVNGVLDIGAFEAQPANDRIFSGTFERSFLDF